jgi:predicted GH43/DUF377 family glycosyl hydrolase
MKKTTTENFHPAQSKERLWHLRLGVIIGTALLLLVVLLAGLRGMTPVRAASSILYVDGPSGQDTPTCGTTTTPCKTISYTLNIIASSGDTIRIAQGTYTENLTIDNSMKLEGGYEATSWKRSINQYDTIIDGSGSQPAIGDWDGFRIEKPAVISDSVEYKMWYDGVNLLDEQQIGLAMSSDGISWTRYVTNPVVRGTSGAWDENGEHAPFVLKEGGVYKMWYEGNNNGNVRQLGYATSTDGKDWNKHTSNPVLNAGPEKYDQKAAGHGSVLKDGSTYKLWYHAIGDEGAIIAYATSVDGISWTKQGPVLKPASGKWDEFGLWGPSVLKRNGTYWMWYAAAGSQGPPAIGVVTSTNGITWTRFLADPVVTGTSGIGDPHVIDDAGKLKMWYHDLDQGVINYAESTDGISWTKSLSNPVLTPGDPGQLGEPVVRFVTGSDGAVLDGFTITGGNVGRDGGGIAIDAAAPVIESCIIRDNNAKGQDEWGGGGILVGSGASPIISNTLITNNSAEGGASGVRVGDGSFTMVNSLVVGNSGRSAIHANDAAMTLTNVTIADNGSDGGLWLNNSHATIRNSIVWEEQGQDIGVDGSGSYTITYSNVEDSVLTGAGNISADPLFEDAANGDYHLQLSSPCVDAGTNTNAPDHDWEGDPRPIDGNLDGSAITDMGADELKLYSLYLPIIFNNYGP